MGCVLVGFNGSDCALAAVLRARDIALERAARLHILTAVTVPAFGLDACMDDVMEQQIAHCDAALQSLKARLPETRDMIRLSLRIGDPWRVVVDYAAEYGAGEIVVGCRGQWFRRWPASRVVRRIVAHAPCAVTVVMNQRYAPLASTRDALA